MSAPPGRSATVTSLSGRVNALKFMQRATASSASSAASASNTRTESSTASQRTPPASRSPATTSPSASIRASPLLGAAEEEQWSLSPAAIAKLRTRAQAQAQAQAQSQSQSQSHQSTTQEPKRPKIYQEAGFDAWLIEREKQLSDEATNRINQRHTFGQLGKQQGGDEDEDEDEGEDEEQDSRKRPRGQTDDEQGQESEESEEQGSQPRFVKPGSLGKRSKSNTKHIANGSPDSLSNKANKGKRRTSNDQDKVVFTRKRGGKPGISGGGR